MGPMVREKERVFEPAYFFKPLLVEYAIHVLDFWHAREKTEHSATEKAANSITAQEGMSE